MNPLTSKYSGQTAYSTGGILVINVSAVSVLPRSKSAPKYCVNGQTNVESVKGESSGTHPKKDTFYSFFSLKRHTFDMV